MPQGITHCTLHIAMSQQSLRIATTVSLQLKAAHTTHATNNKNKETKALAQHTTNHISEDTHVTVCPFNGPVESVEYSY